MSISAAQPLIRNTYRPAAATDMQQFHPPEPRLSATVSPPGGCGKPPPAKGGGGQINR